MISPATFSKIEDELALLSRNKMYRRLRPSSGGGIEATVDGKKVLLFCSNDYLGLSRHPEVINAAMNACSEYGTGSGASRLISGNIFLYEQLEDRLARFKQSESALVYSSGYHANIGVISCLAKREDTIFIDRLSHASIVDGCILSRAKIIRFNHNDPADLAEKIKKANPSGKQFVITEGLFSMDSDIAPLKEISEIANENSCLLIVDDAHGTGVLGKNGKGAAEHCNCSDLIDIQIGTLSKAIGSLGGFTILSNRLREYLINKSKSFIFTTALPPAGIAAAIKSLELIETGDLRKKLQENWEKLRRSLIDLSFDVPSRTGPIIPILTGDAEKAVKFSEKLIERGFFVPAIRPPAVEQGRSRLRVTVSAMHEKKQIELLTEAMSEIGKELDLIE